MAVAVAGAMAAGTIAVTQPSTATQAAVTSEPDSAEPGSAGSGEAAGSGKSRDYLVFHSRGGHAATVKAVQTHGGTVVTSDAKLDYLVARSSANPNTFAERVGREPAVVGVTVDKAIGHASAASGRAGGAVQPAAQTEAAETEATRGGAQKGEPLAKRQWNMDMIGATADKSYKTAPGSHRVLVGVIDTGIDGKHPDIAPNFNRELSRNFVTDRPVDSSGQELDGPCEHTGCKDPADVDDDGHGTHVASIIASPRNGVGVAGVAPNVDLVNLRAGQDSGFFFLKPSLDALTYAGDIGVDVVNMSYYIDPWLFNCVSNPKDSKAEQLEQRAIVTGMQRAVDYARSRGVTMIAALGNGSTDLGKIREDTASPDYPQGAERSRKVDNSCLNVPAESKGVISVSGLGPSGDKALYSDYGIEQTDLSAPGGDSDTDKGPLKGERRMILAAAPERALRAAKLIDANGKPKTSSVVRECTGGKCSYYQYLQGTSMAAPHATGVAAILIDRFGSRSGDKDISLSPARTESLLNATASPRPCPSPRAYVYKLGATKETHRCEGTKGKNGFYGKGIVSASRAATFNGP
ncbi:serine protease [Sinosporangium siamense]|uniref:Serine protease n=2 Tax=Sinosporangium siamense TaxID=1367973 RepID=A0A919REG1_9ACTN|nr:serine protease [Sinosporangium siamense]